ncbi:helix-turn-helix domain-containing protein [Mycolicibacterium sp. Y3]
MPYTLCPVARSVPEIGDRWTLLILRELTLGTTRFDDLQRLSGATAQLLTARLKQLQTDGIVDRHAYSERPRRYDYRLTEKGRDFLPVMLALRAWGETWCKDADEPVAIHLRHTECGTELALDGTCPACARIVPAPQTTSELDPQFAAERKRHLSPAPPCQ